MKPTYFLASLSIFLLLVSPEYCRTIDTSLGVSRQSQPDWRHHVAGEEKLKEAVIRADRLNHRAFRLLEKHKIDQAYQLYSDYVAQDPMQVDLLWTWYFSCALLDKKYDVALDGTMAILKKQAKGNPIGMLQYAAACAGLGHVEAGQEQFCIDQIRESLFLRGHANDKLDLGFPIDGSAKSLKKLSLLALGFSDLVAVSPLFFEAVLKEDHTNLLAAREAIRLYGYSHQYAKLRDVAATIASHLPGGPLKKEFDDIAQANKDGKDAVLFPETAP